MPSALPHVPAPYEAADCAAFIALAQGSATPEQQKRALDWIIRGAAGTYDLSYRPDSERATAFAEGKRFVGLQVVKLTQTSTLAAVEKKAKEAK